MRLSVTKQRYLSILEEIKKSGGKVDSGEPNDSVLLIDGLNTFIRVFSAIPTTNEDGVHIGGIVGFLRSIGYTINMVRPTRTIIVFDGKGGSNRRRKIFPEYKAGRKMSVRLNRHLDVSLTREQEHKMMIRQLNRLIEYLECLPLTIITQDNIEADDVIGYCSKHLFKDNKSTIMSTDKDFLQLIDKNIRVYSPTKKLMYDEERVLDEYGIASTNFLLYRILDGDKSDGIPGIKGADLDELNISGSSKLKIQDHVKFPIQRLVKHKFQRMFLEDKLYTALPNLDSWLHSTFNRLNQMAEKSHG